MRDAQLGTELRVAQGIDGGAVILIRVRPLFGDALGNPLQVRPCGRERDSRGETADHAQAVAATAARRPQRGHVLQRPQAGRRVREAEVELKRARHDADDRGLFAIESELPPYDLGVCAEAGPPQRFAHDHDVGVQRVVGRAERAADERRDAEDLEESRRHGLARNCLGYVVGAGQSALRGSYRGHRFEGAAALAPRQKLIGGYDIVGRTRASLPQHRESIGVAKRQRAYPRRIGQREDGAVDADSERERHDCDDGEARCLDELADGVAQVLKDGPHVPNPARGMPMRVELPSLIQPDLACGVAKQASRNRDAPVSIVGPPLDAPRGPTSSGRKTRHPQAGPDRRPNP